MGEQTFLTLYRSDKKVDARALLGLTAQETDVTQPQRALLVGSWFRPGDTYACIIPKEIADGLSISLDSVEKGAARVRYGGVDYLVRGVIDNDTFKSIKDLDQEPITPVDFILMQRQQGGGGGSQQAGGDAGFREYTHLEPSTVFIIPYQTLMNQGGEVRSVAINFVTQQEVDRVRKDLMPRLGLNLYAGHGGRTYRYSSIGSTSIAGAGTLLIPILIAALIVLNTMLGAVFERQKEIHIFSSIGLAPNHVAMLFIAESVVYAILGAMAGYLLGQGSAKLIVAMDWLPGLNLNFSSVSAVFSTLLVMAVVLLSTMYPARKASEVATPAIDRTWRTPEPVGDTWRIPLPFMVTGEQAVGLNGFLGEWFRAYEEYSIGDFVTQNVEAREYAWTGAVEEWTGGGEEERTSGRVDEKARGTGDAAVDREPEPPVQTPDSEPLDSSSTQSPRAYQIRLMAWLAPFDLGVSQQVVIDTTPTDMQDVFEIRLTIHRVSGDISNWKRVNRRFLNTLRKQFLIWRTLGAEERERYLADVEQKEAATESAATAPA